MMMCIDEEILELYVLNRLPEEEAEKVEDHLALCAACQRQAEELEVMAERLSAALRESPPASAPISLEGGSDFERADRPKANGACEPPGEDR
jgi:anti-sigma factor RsiW